MADLSSTNLLEDLTEEAKGTPISPDKRKKMGVTFALDSVTVKQILDLLTNSVSQVVENMLSTILAEWGVMQWEDLIVFTCDDVNEFFKSNFETTPVVIKKRLGFIVDYSKIGPLGTMTMSKIVTAVTASKMQGAPSAIVQQAPVINQGINKKTVPTIDTFSGLDEDFFAWKDKSVNTLGRSGLTSYLSDATLYATNKELAESVFYTIREALTGGVASSHAETLVDRDTLNPTILWSNLLQYYDTDLNRANVVLFEIKRLLALSLNIDNTPVQFISDFRECLQRLRKSNAKVADDTDTLRALLLVAIQDDSYDSIRDTIVEKPKRNIDELLTDIRQKDTSLQIKDGARDISGEYSKTRRTQMPRTPYKGNPKVNVSEAIKKGQWIIPHYPDGWKEAFGEKMFKVLMDWRKSACFHHKLQSDLNTNYALHVDSKSPKRSRKTTTQEDEKDSQEDNTSAPSSPKKRRILLNKSRRVVTERA